MPCARFKKHIIKNTRCCSKICSAKAGSLHAKRSSSAYCLGSALIDPYPDSKGHVVWRRHSVGVRAYLFEDKLCTGPTTPLPRFIIDIGNEVQYFHGLDHPIEYGLVVCSRSYLKPACLALCPYRIRSVRHLAIREARYIPYLNVCGLIGFLVHCCRVSKWSISSRSTLCSYKCAQETYDTSIGSALDSATDPLP